MNDSGGHVDASNIDLYLHTGHVDRLFVLGAGFSMSASEEFPLTDSLLPALFKEDPVIERAWAEFAPHYQPFARVREASGVSQFTSVLTALEAHRQLVGKRGRADDKIRELRTRILYACSTLLYRLSERAAGSPVLAAFVKELDPESDAVLTLNWDIALELALQQAGKRFQYDVLPASSDRRPHGLLVLKPQGSVTWRRITPTEPVTSPVLKVKPAPASFQRAEPREAWTLCQLAAPPEPFPANGRTVSDPAIIPPSLLGEDRATDLDWSGYMLKVATHAAIQAAKIVVVGYSLPVDDFHVLAALSFGVQQDGDGGGVKVYVVDPSAATFQRWDKGFSGLTTNTHTRVDVTLWAENLSDALGKRGGPWT